MILVLLGLFGGVTVLLVAVGTWAVISYSVADRARELAVRLALGAEGGGIVRLVMRQVTVVAVLGGILGLAGGLGGTHVLQGFLFNTSPRDPRVILVGCSFILAVVSLASYLPARRATRVDPARELKALE
jgi:ABC-type antimicrobial peptide transport system permease subunit